MSGDIPKEIDKQDIQQLKVLLFDGKGNDLARTTLLWLRLVGNGATEHLLQFMRKKSSRMFEDILKEIDEQDIPKLRALYEGHLPRAVHIYNYLESVIRWKKQRPDKKYITLMAPGGDWSNGTFVAVHEYTCYEIFLFAFEKYSEVLYTALTKTKKIDWNKDVILYAIHYDLYPTVAKALKETTFGNHIIVHCDIRWMPKEKAVNLIINCPQEVYISELKPQHTTIINSNWPHRYKDSEKYIATMIEMNGGCGVFLKSDGSLVAWALKNLIGLGVLQTHDDFKRRGYGSLVAKALAKKLAEEGADPLGTVLKSNSASQSMFTKIGFETMGSVMFLDNTQPTTS